MQTAREMRKVDIDQLTPSRLAVVSASDAGPARLAQADQIAETGPQQMAAAYIPQLSDAELDLWRAEMPAQLAVRLSDTTIGQVAFRVADNRGIEIQLAGLISLVAESLPPGEAERLAGAAAAQDYVSLDELAARGLPMRYNAAYDELQFAL
ncbi:hypothetical protein [Aurantiacibacter spongiae]|uniref:Uncharacterized protein n=1 Tax=Aurantiacibacter spongiae TaxID=2488860 RepID=A0A3N5DPA2_9SPHN|nr:hypothetical protein [Aurantiacibacter spongiae]RPF70941.1 hypothetical protein EG799_04395 [Aurantiacibacter spongiae]